MTIPLLALEILQPPALATMITLHLVLKIRESVERPPVTETTLLQALATLLLLVLDMEETSQLVWIVQDQAMEITPPLDMVTRPLLATEIALQNQAMETIPLDMVIRPLLVTEIVLRNQAMETTPPLDMATTLPLLSTPLALDTVRTHPAASMETPTHMIPTKPDPVTPTVLLTTLARVIMTTPQALTLERLMILPWARSWRKLDTRFTRRIWSRRARLSVPQLEMIITNF